MQSEDTVHDRKSTQYTKVVRSGTKKCTHVPGVVVLFRLGLRVCEKFTDERSAEDFKVTTFIQCTGSGLGDTLL